MSKNNRTSGRDRVRHRRTARQPGAPQPTERTREERVLGQLPYRKGHLTEQELACFATLRGELTAEEQHELHRVAKTLRRVTKRLRALDLILRWGAPLSPQQRLVLPLLAGLAWTRPLPATPLKSVAELAQHLVFQVDAPRFLLHPFTHPEHYPRGTLAWEMARIAGVVGSGDGLTKLRELENFWTWVPERVFASFLHTPEGTPVGQGLVAAFVADWGGPDWVADVVYRTALRPHRGIRYGLPLILRTAQALCSRGVDRDDAEAEAARLFSQLPDFTTLFGRVPPLGITSRFPDSLNDWRARELLTPEDFERGEGQTRRHLTLHFQDALEQRISLWELSGEGRTVFVQIDRDTRRAWHFDGVYREPDEQAERVIAPWAQASGLRT